MDEGGIEVTAKGLVFDDEGQVMLLHEKSGIWDLPGGRLRHGESFAECLQRECREEMGVGCAILDPLPRFAWTAYDKSGSWRVMLCFRIAVDHFDFHESDECDGYGFFTKESLASLDLTPQTRPLREWM